MSDSEITLLAPPAPSEQDSTPPMEAQPRDPQPQNDQNPQKSSGLSLRIWPPTQRTRDAVVARLIETLSTPSVLSKRYGTMSSDEAASTARLIEEEAFSVAGTAASSEDDGIEILQLYSKEISKRMLERVKARASAPSVAAADDSGVAPAATASEDSSSVQTEA